MSELLSKISEVADSIKSMRGSFSTRIGELERRAAREPANDNYIAHNDNNPLAAALLDSKEIRDLSSTFRGKAVVKIASERAAITSANTTVGAGRSAGTSLVPGMRMSGIVTPFERPLRIRDLCTVGRTASSNVEWVKETGFTNNSRPVTETTTKPTSDITFNMFNSPVRTIAHVFKISRQMLDDAPALAAYVGARGSYGLKLSEEAQLLTGNNAGQNLNGIVPQATAYSPLFATDAEQAFDRVNAALAQIESAYAVADGVVLNPIDWRAMIGIKDGDERYISAASPFGMQVPSLWNVPVVTSASIPQGEFLVGQFKDNCFIFDRLDTEVLLSTEDGDNFQTNQVTVRVESRLSFVVTRSEALVTGDLTASSD